MTRRFGEMQEFSIQMDQNSFIKESKYTIAFTGAGISVESGIPPFSHEHGLCNKYNPEVVFHLAAQALVRFSYYNPKLTFDTNVAGSVNVLEAIRASDSVRSFVYVTSDKAYKNKELTLKNLNNS